MISFPASVCAYAGRVAASSLGPAEQQYIKPLAARKAKHFAIDFGTRLGLQENILDELQTTDWLNLELPVQRLELTGPENCLDQEIDVGLVLVLPYLIGLRLSMK